jgi:hypothetical protein
MQYKQQLHYLSTGMLPKMAHFSALKAKCGRTKQQRIPLGLEQMYKLGIIEQNNAQ